MFIPPLAQARSGFETVQGIRGGTGWNNSEKMGGTASYSNDKKGTNGCLGDLLGMKSYLVMWELLQNDYKDPY